MIQTLFYDNVFIVVYIYMYQWIALLVPFPLAGPRSAIGRAPDS